MSSDQIMEFVDRLELPYEGEMKGDQYIVNVDTSNKFSQLFNIIDINKELHIKGDSQATAEGTQFRFTDGSFDVVLTADYENDVYQLVVEVE